MFVVTKKTHDKNLYSQCRERVERRGGSNYQEPGGRMGARGPNVSHNFSLLLAALLFVDLQINPLTPELNPSTQRCLQRCFTGDFSF
jgi:hypothetical protein